MSRDAGQFPSVLEEAGDSSRGKAQLLGAKSCEANLRRHGGLMCGRVLFLWNFGGAVGVPELPDAFNTNLQHVLCILANASSLPTGSWALLATMWVR